MKKLIIFLILSLVCARAASNTGGTYATRTFSIVGSAYDVSFEIHWWSDDFPMYSAPGRIELFDSSGNFVGRVVASDYEGSGPSVSVSGGGSVDQVVSNIGRYAGGTPADGLLSGVWHITGLSPGSYQLRLWRYQTWDTSYSATTIWTIASMISGAEPGPTNASPSVTLLSPGDQTVTAGTTLTITSHATDADGNIASHNLDIQRPGGDWNFQGGFATGEPFQGGPVGSAGDSTRSANFTFTDVGTYYVRSAADDGTGWVQSATVAITVVAPPAVQYSLATDSSGGGSVSPGGTYDAGTVVYITATPDSTHDFAGWSGDATGMSNPVGVSIDRPKSVVANFSPKLFALVTSATVGGGVTLGGSYPYGTSVTVSATPDSTHRFIGWAGDAAGAATSIVLTVTNPLNVQAVFGDKTSQTIAFPSPGNQPAPGSFVLGGNTSSGLPLNYAVLSGPAILSGNTLQIVGPGAITVQASQPGNSVYLPAPSISRTFNAVASASVKYRPAGRTIFQAAATSGAAPFVLEKP
jgi:hypothetical protein